MKERFENAVSVLVKAYLNDTLSHSLCSACAVGNLVAAAKGTTQVRLSRPFKREYSECPFLTMLEFENNLYADGSSAWKWYTHMSSYRGGSYRENNVEGTGYSISEISKIEYAFESAKPGTSPDEWNFNGLMAVVDVLAKIDNIDLESTQKARALFVK